MTDTGSGPAPTGAPQPVAKGDAPPVPNVEAPRPAYAPAPAPDARPAADLPLKSPSMHGHHHE
jgi:hypothetical protein